MHALTTCMHGALCDKLFNKNLHGYSGVAKVVKLGKGVTSLKEGQRVVGIPWTGLFGTWQQYRTMPAASLVSPQSPVCT